MSSTDYNKYLNVNTQKVQIFDDEQFDFVDLIPTTDSLVPDSSTIIPTSKAVRQIYTDVKELKQLLTTINYANTSLHPAALIREDLSSIDLENNIVKELNVFFKEWDDISGDYVVKHFYRDIYGYYTHPTEGWKYNLYKFCDFSDDRVHLYYNNYYVENRAKPTDDWYNDPSLGVLPDDDAKELRFGHVDKLEEDLEFESEGNVIAVKTKWQMTPHEFKTAINNYVPEANLEFIVNSVSHDTKVIAEPIGSSIIYDSVYDINSNKWSLYSNNRPNIQAYYYGEIVKYVDGKFYTLKENIYKVTANGIPANTIEPNNSDYWEEYVPTNEFVFFYDLGNISSAYEDRVLYVEVSDKFGYYKTDETKIRVQQRFFNLLNKIHLSDVLENSKKEFKVSWNTLNGQLLPIKVDFYYSGWDSDNNLVASKIVDDSYQTSLELSDVGDEIEKLYAGNCQGSRLRSAWMELTDGFGTKKSEVALFTVLENFIIFELDIDKSVINQSFAEQQTSSNPANKLITKFSGLNNQEFFPLKLTYKVDNNTYYPSDELCTSLNIVDKNNTLPNPIYIFHPDWDYNYYSSIMGENNIDELTEVEFNNYKSFYTYNPITKTFTCTINYYLEESRLINDVDVNVQAFLHTRELSDVYSGAQDSIIQEYYKPSVIKTFKLQDLHTELNNNTEPGEMTGGLDKESFKDLKFQYKDTEKTFKYEYTITKNSDKDDNTSNELNLIKYDLSKYEVNTINDHIDLSINDNPDD